MSNIQQSLQGALSDLKMRYPISEMALFGSYARGTETEKSDVDILVSFSGPIGIQFIDLADELEKLLGKKVDLITKEGLKPRQWEYLKDKVIYV
ncbi:MAG TPA: nucleotidyltransferase family protein [Bacteroidia bacterium]|nr:nucleotidyltransferase family protein [Bacteroidia bacterium]